MTPATGQPLLCNFAKAAKPVILQFNVKADKPLQIGNINKVLSDLGHPDWMGMIINLTGPRR